MTEDNNVAPLESGRAEKPSRFRVRDPKIRDAKAFVGAIASAQMGDDTLQMAATGENQAAVVMAVKDAVASPDALDKLMYVFADLWEYEPPAAVLEAAEPPEEWEYDPPNHLVQKGQLIGRDEQWRSLSRRQKKRLVKKLTLEDEGLGAIEEFATSIQQLPMVRDFLSRSEKSAQEGSGSSMTSSNDATGGSPSVE